MPAMVSNAIPPILSKLFPKFLNIPIDFGLKLRGKRILGNHKTIRGFVFGSIIAWVFWVLLYKKFSLNNFGVFYGLFVGMGALLGDSLKSFFKRQLDVKEGKTWFPFDQIDWILGFLVILSLYIGLTFGLIVFYIVLGLLMHLIAKSLGYLLKINDVYF